MKYSQPKTLAHHLELMQTVCVSDNSINNEIPTEGDEVP